MSAKCYEHHGKLPKLCAGLKSRRNNYPYKPISRRCQTKFEQNIGNIYLTASRAAAYVTYSVFTGRNAFEEM